MNRQDLDRLIDRFVRTVNRAVRQRIREEDLPVRLRDGAARFGLYYSWNIQPFPQIHWIEPLEARFGGTFPPSYRSLVSRYIFPSFQAPPLILLGNTGQSLYNEMSDVILRDRALADGLVAQGYIQIARPCDGDYDPICFDLNRRGADGECPLVRIDHEKSLRDIRPVVAEQIASSFAAFVETVLASESPVDPSARIAEGP
jgi:hypothetical protein